MTLLFLLVIAVAVVFGVKDIRRQIISRPTLAYFRRALPSLSKTEREAMEAGDVWWDGELLRGKPDWNRLLATPANMLTTEEQAFLDGPVVDLLKMLDDYQIVHDHRDLPKPVWDFIRQNQFFALIIPKAYGGLAFSAYASSTIVARVASRSITAAITIMVPNSLGPGELLVHYGTEAQKQRWLPGLADGSELPCFALTGPTAGSDAGAIPDEGIVCKGEFEGKEVLGLRLNWDKRYITLAPVAKVIGLAFKLRDPDGLLGGEIDRGITCALVPASLAGVESGNRHDPLGLPFQNGTTRGKDVFIPLDAIIGGSECIGRGWRMLVESLSAGRGISLPALSSAIGHLATRTSSAYCQVRKQFGVAIGEFEGIQEALARIAANTYTLEASRKLTAAAIDTHHKPSVLTAIAKYHMTELGRTVINDAMDIHGGKGIQLGPKNYLGHQYLANPISITVEGANILTRNLMIFGQGAVRGHPYLLSEMEALAIPNEEAALNRFDNLLFSHLVFIASNAGRSLFHALTGSRFAKAPVSGNNRRYFQHLSRQSANLALMTDLVLALFGGELKRREMLSARMGDVLSQLYLGSAVLRNIEADGHQHGDLPLAHYALEQALAKSARAMEGVIRNLPNRPLAWLARLLVFPLGNHFNGPSDELAKNVAKAIQVPGSTRNRVSHLCPLVPGKEDGIYEVEQAFLKLRQGRAELAKLKVAQQKGSLPPGQLTDPQLAEAVAEGLLNEDEAQCLKEIWQSCRRAIDVDEFSAV